MSRKDALTLHPIAYMRSDFPTKFGIPRQSGLVSALSGAVVFAPDFRDKAALRGLEDFSHIWLLWGFSGNRKLDWSPTVRPPRLGGNIRMGVFATRSPYRPNPIGLSCLQLEGIQWDSPEGPMLLVSGGDLMDGTPIYDIKPYLPYADCQPNATGGFTQSSEESPLQVVFPPEWAEKVPERLQESIVGILSQDPRPRYHHDAERVYGMPFGGLEIKFTVREGVATVQGIYPAEAGKHIEGNEAR